MKILAWSCHCLTLWIIKLKHSMLSCYVPVAQLWSFHCWTVQLAASPLAVGLLSWKVRWPRRYQCQHLFLSFTSRGMCCIIGARWLSQPLPDGRFVGNSFDLCKDQRHQRQTRHLRQRGQPTDDASTLSVRDLVTQETLWFRGEGSGFVTQIRQSWMLSEYIGAVTYWYTLSFMH